MDAQHFAAPRAVLDAADLAVPRDEVRVLLEELDLGPVFDRTGTLDEVSEGYRLMNDRDVLKFQIAFQETDRSTSEEVAMSDVIVVIGAGSIGQAIARRVSVDQSSDRSV